MRASSRGDVIEGLEGCGHLCAATGRPAEATTVWAAMTALSQHDGFTDPVISVRRRHEPLRDARRVLGAARTRAAEERGAAMSIPAAAEYALMLTAPDPPEAAAPGPGTLSVRERELVTPARDDLRNVAIVAHAGRGDHGPHRSLSTGVAHINQISALQRLTLT